MQDRLHVFLLFPHARNTIENIDFEIIWSKFDDFFVAVYTVNFFLWLMFKYYGNDNTVFIIYQKQSLSIKYEKVIKDDVSRVS